MKCSLYNQAETDRLAGIILEEVPNIGAAITPEGRDLMALKFLQDGETVEQRLALACAAFATGVYQALRLAYYISKGWFMFATPLLANGGTNRGLPISCYLNYVGDSLGSLADHYTENIFLSTNGGGIGAHWSDVRAAGTPTSKGSEASGPIACIKVADSQVAAFRQGRTRQGAYAAYLRVDHPEIMEFLTIRSNDGGNSARKSFNTHIGVVLTDSFMKAVHEGVPYDIVCPHTGDIVTSLEAREVWGEILKLRMTDRGEPYLFHEGVANHMSPYLDRSAIKGSNLCTEITLKTDSDTTAVCCLSSVNALHYGDWVKDDRFIYDLVSMLDNALTVFIRNAPAQMHKAVASVRAERSIGLGLMGLHSYLQDDRFSFEDSSGSAIFSHLQYKARLASRELGRLMGCPPLAENCGLRNLHVLAVAPNASSSIMLGVSPGVEPWRSNIFTVVQGPLMFEVKNPALDEVINDYLDIEPDVTPEEVWEDIREHGGSVQHLDWLGEMEKDCFKTAVEIDQMKLVVNARLRQRYICQAQSINLFFRPDANPREVNEVHLTAFSPSPDVEGFPLKSLYYLRTVVSDKVERVATATVRDDSLLGELHDAGHPLDSAQCSIDNKDECLACQG